MHHTDLDKQLGFSGFQFPTRMGIIIKPILKGCGKTKYKKRLSYSICHTVSTQYITVTITTIVDVISVSFSPCKQGLQYVTSVQPQSHILRIMLTLNFVFSDECIYL